MTLKSDLVLADITKRYEDRMVLDGVCLTARAGETVAVVGPSGSGKSTLLHIVGSLERPDTGRVCFGETDVTALDGAALAEYRASTVGFVFQDHHLLPQLTALENVLLTTLALPRARRAAPEAARTLLEQVGVTRRADAFPAQMSGGERQRVAVARALVNRPKLLLCDEPTGNLDRENGAAVVSLLLELSARDGVTVLMVTHNTGHAARFSRTLALAAGHLASFTSDGGGSIME